MAQHIRETPQPIRQAPQNMEEAIRSRAYELYEQRGHDDGHDIDDWLRAEEEVRQRKIRSTAA
ncbi:MAG TPA: DUF2934 domain-containing protein [Terriglobales bacterium]|nr:DUF2934 domain-containing protein [Terriglobales bacterium]